VNDVQRELDRIVDRLTSMPLHRAATTTADCRHAAGILLEQTRLITDDIPPDAQVPALAPQGLGALIAVLGRDYLDAARAASEPDLDPVLAALVELRRALP